MDRQKFHNYFYVFLGGFLGLLVSLFFLHFIHTLASGKILRVDLIAFFNASLERQLEAGGIIIGFVLLGLVLANRNVAYQNVKNIKKRIKILEDLDRTRTEFIWMASHQLQTPLSALKWSINMILEGDFGRLTKEQQGILSEVYTANERLIILISELLNVAQLEAKRLELNLENVSLNQFQERVEQAVKELKIWAEKKDLFLTFESSLPLLPSVWVKADISKIQQIIQSLLENAIWYTLPKKSIKVKIGVIKNEVVIQIIDKGIGIPKEEQSKIFSKFFRAGNARKIRSGGTGLGLYLCKIFIEGHEGRIWFVSQENKGSTFSVSLPLKSGKAPEEFLRKL